MSITDNKYNMTMWQGSTFGMSVIVNNDDGTPQNLTGYSARMHIRPTYKSSSIEESLSSANGEITIDGTKGELLLLLPAVRTSSITVDLANGKPPKSVYVYDLEIQNGSTVSKILWGDVTVYGEVTR